MAGKHAVASNNKRTQHHSESFTASKAASRTVEGSANASLASSRLSKQEVRAILRSRDFWISLTAIFLTCLIVTLSSWPIYGKVTMFLAAGGAFAVGVLLGIVFGIWTIKWWKGANWTV